MRRRMRWMMTATMVSMALTAAVASAQETAGVWLPALPETECVRPECARVAARLAELEARLGDRPAPDESPSIALMVTGGVGAAGGVALLLATIFTASCPRSGFLSCDLQLNTALLLGGIITGVIGAVLLAVGLGIRASHGDYRRRDGLRRWLRRHDERARREAAALPFAITF